MKRHRQNQPLHTRARVGYIDDDWLIDYNEGRHGIIALSEKRPYAEVAKETRWDRKTMKAARRLADLRWVKRQLWEREGIDPPIEELPEDEWKDSV